MRWLWQPDAGRIADEKCARFAGLVGSRVNVTLKSKPEIPSAGPDPVVRTVTENGRALKFVSHGFDADLQSGRDVVHDQQPGRDRSDPSHMHLASASSEENRLALKFSPPAAEGSVTRSDVRRKGAAGVEEVR